MTPIKQVRNVKMALLALGVGLVCGQSALVAASEPANDAPVAASREFETAFACQIAENSQTTSPPEVPLICDEPAPLPPVRPDAPNVFGRHAVPVGSSAIQAKWNGARMVPFGERPGAWDELLEPANLAASGERLDAINRWVNWHVRFVEDAGSDEWSGAQNTLTRGYGDCEDFAIVKLALLEKAGVPADSMYLVIVRDTSGPRDHAVLAVRQDGNLKILDSRTDKLLTDQDVTDYIPIISYSGTFAWIYGTRQFDTEGQQASLHQSANLEVQPGQPSDRN